MKNTELQILRKSIEELSLKAKVAFMRKFPYLKITDIERTDLLANKIQFDVPETDGSLLIGLSCRLVRPFSIVEQILFDRRIASFNLKIPQAFDKKVTIVLDRFFYHTKKKIIFSM